MKKEMKKQKKSSVNSVNFAKGVKNMDCEKILNERMKDAENTLKSGYNEQAEFDAALISVVLGLCEKSPKAIGAKNALVQDVAKFATSASGVDYFGIAIDEVKGAENYWKLYQDTSDDRFRQMAKQELGHAAALAAMMKEHGEKENAATIDEKLRQLEKVVK